MILTDILGHGHDVMPEMVETLESVQLGPKAPGTQVTVRVQGKPEHEWDCFIVSGAVGEVSARIHGRA